MARAKFHIVSLCLVFLFGCESIVEYDIGEHQAQVVVQSIVSTKTNWEVDLSYSQAIYDTESAPTVDNAEIEIAVQEDGEYVQKFLLNNQGNGKYSFGGTPTAGKTYKMTISVDGKTIEAQTYIPKVITPVIDPVKTNRIGDESIELVVSLGENVSDDVYYAMDVVAYFEKEVDATNQDSDESDDEGEESVGTDSNITSLNNTVINRNPQIQGATPASSDGNGNILATASISRLTADINSPYSTDPTYVDGASIKYIVRVWAISAEYYNFLVSNSDNNFTPSTENNPSSFYSNVTNGSGIFAGYSVDEFPIEL